MSILIIITKKQLQDLDKILVCYSYWNPTQF